MRVEDTGLQLVDLLLTGRDLGLQFDDARRLRGETILGAIPRPGSRPLCFQWLMESFDVPFTMIWA